MEIASQPDSLLMCVTIFSQSLSEAKPSWPTPWYSIVDLSKRTWSKPRSCFLYKLLSLTHQLILFNLQEMTVKIWDNAKCKNTYGNAAPGGIMDHMLCAGEQGRDSCSVSNIILGKQGQLVHMSDNAISDNITQVWNRGPWRYHGPHALRRGAGQGLLQCK